MGSTNQQTKLQSHINNLRSEINLVGLQDKERVKIERIIEDFEQRFIEEESSVPKLQSTISKNETDAFLYYPGVVLVLDPDRKVVYQSKRVFNNSDCVGKYFEDLWTETDRVNLLKSLSRVEETGEQVELSLLKSSDKKFYKTFITPYYHYKADYLLVFLKDYVSNEAATSSDELINKYNSIVKSLSDIFFILDKELKFSFIAPSISKILNFSYKELVGKRFDTLVPKWSGNTLQRHLPQILNLKQNSSKPLSFTIQLSGKYGQLRWYEVQLNGIYSDDNEVQGYNGVCRDITERLKYEDSLKQAKQKAEESDLLKSTFLANMSHEIRTPLNGIIGFSTLMGNDSLSEEKKERYLDNIKSSSKQLLTLINDIIDVSKIEASQLSIYHNEVELCTMMRELADTIGLERERLGRKDVEIIQTLPEKPLEKIYTDEIRVRQVLINLLNNALKFTTKGSIEYGYTIEDGCLRFFVKDTGTGMPESIQKVVFNRFSQGKIDQVARKTGTGLGLAISKGIVELLGGNIGLKSQPGKGSEFYFNIPF